MVNTKQKDEIEFAAFMGIDWADQTHAWALELPTHCGVEHGDLAHTPEALEAWAAELAHRFGGQRALRSRNRRADVGVSWNWTTSDDEIQW